MSRQQKAFTLLELLVVISIITLLVSMLLPAMNLAMRSARSVTCVSNMHQWGIVFAAHLADNDGHYLKGYINYNVVGEYDLWMNGLRSYYVDGKIRLCPEADKPAFPLARQRFPLGDTFLAWGKMDGHDPSQYNNYPSTRAGDTGSYAINGWVCDPPRDQQSQMHGGFADDFHFNSFWRHPDHANIDRVPVFHDSFWHQNWPKHTAAPPLFDGYINGAGGNMLGAINRHTGAINLLFMDGSARSEGLKSLWRLKWHRNYPVNAPSPVWPAWMSSFH